MNDIKQKVCQFLKLHLEVRYNDSEIEELTNYILKSDIFKNEYMVELVYSRSIQTVLWIWYYMLMNPCLFLDRKLKSWFFGSNLIISIRPK